MTQNGPSSNNGTATANLTLSGGAAIVAPISMFPNGVPNNALVVLPIAKPSDELVAMLQKGPAAVTPDQMWQLLGFNGPAVQVQDNEGRPIAIGLEDLLSGLEKHWTESQDDLNRGRVYAQELIKHQRFEKAEQVLAKVVAKGGLNGDDWMALGITQLQLNKLDKAESTLKGAKNILKTNPFPSLHLAKVMKEKGDTAAEKAMVLDAISIEPQAVDAWAYLFNMVRTASDDAKAIAEVEALAGQEKNAKTAAPYIAIQGFYANEEETRDQAVKWATKACERNSDDPLALLCLSALLGQTNQLGKVIELLQPHEPKMLRDVRLAHNYLEALFQSGQIDKCTRLLNALAGSPNREVKQFAIDRSKQISQWLQRQQQQLATQNANSANNRKA